MGDKIWKRIAPYKYPLLMLIVGVAIMAWPKAESPPVVEEPVAVVQNLEDRLGAVLSQAAGAGRVEVVLQYENDGHTVYQTDTTPEGKTTVLDGGPIVVEKVSPRVAGALVLAEGGDSPTVRLNLVNAVSSLTGLGADKITVIKME